MDNNHSPEQEKPRMSRSQYRQQQTAGKPSSQLSDEEPAFQEMSRQATADERHEQTAAEKTTQLKRRLNIAIIGLVIAIVIVYLILFYVG